MKPRLRLLQLALVLAALLSLAATSLAKTSMPPFDPTTAPDAPDYARKESWLVLPAEPGKRAVDVFFAYPTVLGEGTQWLMDPADPDLRRAALDTVRYQAGVFNGQANIYVPLYRQAHMASLALPEAQRALLQTYGREDMERALRYFLGHLSGERPFILAGHSQGSNLLTDIATSEWGSIGGEDRLVAAYLIGWSITGEDLSRNPGLRICREAGETGCFISYNCVAPGRQGVAPTIRPGAIAVNPLSWKTDGALVPASENLGAVFFSKDGSSRTIPEFTSAQAKDGGLEVVPADPSLVNVANPNFPKGVYHAFDYSLFFDNLKENAGRRIKAFQAKTP